MQFVISLCLTIIFVILVGEMLRKKPLPFYVGAILLTLISIFATWNIIGALQTLLKPLSGGALVGAIFVIVMFAGAFPPGGFGAKTFMPVRAQLSIIGGIMAIGHGLSLGKTYFLRLAAIITGSSSTGSFDMTTILALIISAALLIIMLPLFSTSFKLIRSKMNGKSWKKLQRFAYLFYALMFIHILAFEIPKAMRGLKGYAVNVFAYSLVFLCYLFCRILRQVYRNKKELMVRMQITFVTVALLISTAGCAYIVEYASQSEKASVADLPEVAGARKTETSEAVTTEAKISVTETEVAKASETSSEIEIESGANDSYDYVDGIYHGTGMGNNGKIGVEVTISDGKISSISITDFPDDDDYFDVDKDGSGMIENMIASQSAEVDTISGATYSSEGLIDAVNMALSEAMMK